MGMSYLFLFKKLNYLDFLGGPVVKNLPFNAGDERSVPGRRTNISHAAGKSGHHSYRA